MALTKSQQLVYDYLCATMAERAVPPSVREICAATGLRSTSTVHSHLKSLETMGYITRDAGLNRSIHIAGAAAAKQVPILGKVTAGLPILAVEDIEGYIPYQGEITTRFTGSLVAFSEGEATSYALYRAAGKVC